MYKILKASDSYPIREAIQSRMNYRKIYENKIRDQLFSKLNKLLEPEKQITFSYSIYGIKPPLGESDERIYLRGTMMVEVEDFKENV
jgi:hypothetical protein